MNDNTPQVDQGTLRYLKLLTTILTTVMIVGLLTIVALLVIRLNAPATPPLVVPDEIALPENAVVTAVTRGDGWIAVVTEDQRMLFFDATSGEMTGEVNVPGSE